jgi:asparagine synthase (glutamine-hydrolysing)
MCGIAGIFAYASRAAPVDSDEILRIDRCMAARGPDGNGLWSDPERRIALAHRRLAIIDLSPSGAQPMIDEAHGVVITFNGEIYNYRALREDFEARGYRFKSNSDTEVLLAAYIFYGARMVERLRGMFAFAIWDIARSEILLARDPLGIKPLYYSDYGGTFRFASQVKALLAGGVAGRGASWPGHVGYFLWGHVPEPHTLYADILSLPAGSTLVVDRHGPRAPIRYWQLTTVLQRAAASSPPPESERAGLLADALRTSVRDHLVSDVPVGVFLSAGLDSSTILGHAREVTDVQLMAFTLGFEQFRGTPDDEVDLAEKVAADFAIRAKTTWIDRDDFLSSLDRIVEAMDQPSTDGVNTYLVSQEGSRAGMKVALTGIGGDEIFGGYPSFWQIPMLKNIAQWVPYANLSGRIVRSLSAPLLRRMTSSKYAGLLEYGINYVGAYVLRRALYMPWEIEQILGREVTAEGLEALGIERVLLDSIEGIASAHACVIALETTQYMRDRLLRDADWASMAHSLEIRVPLADHVLIETLAPILVGKRPYTKRKMAATLDYELPPETLKRPKTGFSVPVRQWISDVLEGSAARERGLRGWAKLIYARQTGQSDVLERAAA